MNVHASCIAIDGQGVLLWGESGVGKSDLALRMIEKGAILVADDYPVLEEKDGILYASCPESIQGKLEIRGLGIFEFPFMEKVPVRLLVDLSPEKEIDRFPLEKIPLPKEFPFDVACIRLRSFEASTPMKIKTYLAFLLEKNKKTE